MQQQTASFLNAVKRGNITTVRQGIASGINVRATDALFLAVDREEYDIIKELVSAGADINQQNSAGETNVYRAADEAHLHTVKLLLELGADVNIATNDGSTPLYIAAKHSLDIKLVRQLLNAGADPNKTKNTGESPLYASAIVGDRAIVKLLLKSGADVSIFQVREKAENGKFWDSQITSLILSQPTSMILPTVEHPANAPLQCFDPIMAENKNISMSEHAVFYIQDASGKTVAAGCLDADTLNVYKTEDNYVFYRCKESTPPSAIMITPDSVYEVKYRLLNFAMRIYVKDADAQKINVGHKYVLRPIEPLGRIASKSVVDGGSVVSAMHCGPADGSFLYSIQKVVAGGRRRKTKRKTRSQRFK